MFKLKAFADDNVSMAQMNHFLYWLDNFVVKGEILFPYRYQKASFPG